MAKPYPSRDQFFADRYDVDPAAKQLTDGRFYVDRTWLEATCGSNYPDAVVGLIEMFVFVAILMVGWFFVIRRGVLGWR